MGYKVNDLYFANKIKKGLKDQSLSQKVYIIRHEVAEYHPSENEYILLPFGFGEFLFLRFVAKFVFEFK